MPSGLLPRLLAARRPRLPLLPIRRLADGGRGATEAAVRALAQPVPFGQGLLLARVLGRYKVLLDTGDTGFAPHLALDGFWEWWTTAHLVRVLKPGMTFVDGGAGYGYFSLLAADLVGPQGHVVAVEPHPRSNELLRRNLELNGLAGVARIEQVALAGESGIELRLDAPPGAPLAAWTGGNGGELVRALALDDLGGPRPDIVKLDLNGGEPRAWDGMRKLLTAAPELRLLTSFDPARTPGARDYLERLAAHAALRRLDGTGHPVATSVAELLNGGEAMLWVAKD